MGGERGRGGEAFIPQRSLAVDVTGCRYNADVHRRRIHVAVLTNLIRTMGHRLAPEY